MFFKVLYHKEQIGIIDLRSDGFELHQFGDAERQKELKLIVGRYYKNGIENVMEKEKLHKVAIMPSDSRFILELPLRLLAKGYSVGL